MKRHGHKLSINHFIPDEISYVRKHCLRVHRYDNKYKLGKSYSKKHHLLWFVGLAQQIL